MNNKLIVGQSNLFQLTLRIHKLYPGTEPIRLFTYSCIVALEI